VQLEPIVAKEPIARLAAIVGIGDGPDTMSRGMFVTTQRAWTTTRAARSIDKYWHDAERIADAPLAGGSFGWTGHSRGTDDNEQGEPISQSSGKTAWIRCFFGPCVIR
jgi:hypothetical protein